MDRKFTLSNVFGFPVNTTVQQLWEGESPASIEIKRKAWFGDSLLSFIVSNILWEKYCVHYKKSRKVGEEEEVEEEGEDDTVNLLEKLTIQRKRFTCNANLARFLISTMQIPPLCGSSNHSMGTLFEWLLYLSNEISESNSRKAVETVMKYMEKHPDDYPIPDSFVHLTVYYNPKENTIRSVESENLEAIVSGNLDLTNLVKKCISEKSAETEKMKKEEKKYWQKEKVKEEDKKKRDHLQSQIEQTEKDPFAKIVLYNSKMLLNQKRSISGGKSTLQSHSGTQVSVMWISGRGNTYTDHFHSCCGLRSESMVCNVPNWPSTEQHNYHPGGLYLYSSKRNPGGRGPQGSSTDHIPVCKWPKWTCCQQLAFHPGCKKRTAKQ